MSKDSPNKQTMVIAKGDSAASHHYWRQEDVNTLSNLRKDTTAKVTLPNAEAIPSNLRGKLSLSSELSAPAQTAIVLPQLKSSSLISLGQLCDDNCDINLNKTTLKVIKNNKVIMRGIRNS